MKLNLKPLLFIVTLIPFYFIGMFFGLIGYDKRVGMFFANYYVWAMK
jgi:hypothetical protein